MAAKPSPPPLLDERSTWDHLQDQEKFWFFERLHARIKSRADEAIEWRKTFAKVIVTTNATAAGATVAFIASIHSRASLSETYLKALDYAGTAAVLFVTGFALSVFFLIAVCLRSRNTLIAESKFLNEVIHNRQYIDWHSNPFLQEVGWLSFAVAVGCAVLSSGFFAAGAYLVTRVLLATS